MKGQGIALGPGSLFKRKQVISKINAGSWMKPVTFQLKLSLILCACLSFFTVCKIICRSFGQIKLRFLSWKEVVTAWSTKLQQKYLCCSLNIFSNWWCGVVQTYCLLIFSQLFCYLNCTHRIVDEQTEMCLCCEPASKVTVCFPSKTDEGE